MLTFIINTALSTFSTMSLHQNHHVGIFWATRCAYVLGKTRERKGKGMAIFFVSPSCQTLLLAFSLSNTNVQGEHVVVARHYKNVMRVLLKSLQETSKNWCRLFTLMRTASVSLPSFWYLLVRLFPFSRRLQKTIEKIDGSSFFCLRSLLTFPNNFMVVPKNTF